MGAQDLPQLLVTALGEEVQVYLAEGRQEPVRIGDGVHGLTVTCGVTDLESVVDQIGQRQCHSEQAALDVLERIALTAHQGHHVDRVGPVGANDRVVVVLVRTREPNADRGVRRRADGSGRPYAVADSGL